MANEFTGFFASPAVPKPLALRRVPVAWDVVPFC